MEYSERGIINYGESNYFPNPAPQYPNSYAYQYWDKNLDGATYTNLFINLIDNYNDRNGWTTSGVANDNVVGYTFDFLEFIIVPNSQNLSSLSNQLKLYKPAGVTDDQIDQLIKYY